MKERTTFKVLDDNGKEVVCEVLFTFCLNNYTAFWTLPALKQEVQTLILFVWPLITAFTDCKQSTQTDKSEIKDWRNRTYHGR